MVAGQIEAVMRRFAKEVQTIDPHATGAPVATTESSYTILGAFVQAGFAASNGEMRRHVKGGAVRVNDDQVSDERMTLTDSNLRDGVIKLSLGKKKHVLVKPV